MPTYRTGNHWGVTIVREPHTGGICADSSCPDRGDHLEHDQAQLVAVVVNGDQELAEDICYRLNSPTPDVPYTNGAREALAEVRRRINASGGSLNLRAILEIIDQAAAELGVDEPRGRP